ncbi:MAG: hypothetical protein GQ554_07890, partial [Deltaproteobacteria bacterium]|nr:hypothetical protein [Deltaproteobacteria bacterium]
MDILLEVLKWVIIVLLAGFIGQFGKSISLHIINYFKKRKAKRTLTEPDLAKAPQVASTESSETIIKKEEKEKQQLKADKKALKDQVKAKKKA